MSQEATGISEIIRDIIPKGARVAMARRMVNHAEKGVKDEDLWSLSGHRHQLRWA